MKQNDRIEIVGTVIEIRDELRNTEFGGSDESDPQTIRRMTIHGDDGIVYTGTRPTGLNISVGDRVSMHVRPCATTIDGSVRYYQRPTKARVVKN